MWNWLVAMVYVQAINQILEDEKKSHNKIKVLWTFVKRNSYIVLHVSKKKWVKVKQNLKTIDLNNNKLTNTGRKFIKFYRIILLWESTCELRIIKWRRKISQIVHCHINLTYQTRNKTKSQKKIFQKVK